jgi:hypothetical protein
MKEILQDYYKQQIEIGYKYKFILILFILVIPVSAITINDSNMTFMLNNVTINFSSQQTFDNLSLYPNQIVLNGYGIVISPNSPINVTINQYNTTSNVYNITFKGNDNSVTLSQAVSIEGTYKFLKNNIFYINLITVGSILSTTVDSNGINTYTWSPVLVLITASQCSQSQNNIYTFSSQSFLIISLAIMIFGFMIVIQGMRGMNRVLIFSGILTTIIGFAMIIIGNYLITAIVTITQC